MVMSWMATHSAAETMSLWMTYDLWMTCQFFTSDICEAIHVTGDNSTSYSEGGLYLPTNERASGAPNNPVWKRSGGKRFIFNDGSSSGWRIGQESGLTTGNYYCKGKHILTIFAIGMLYSKYLCA